MPGGWGGEYKQTGEKNVLEDRHNIYYYRMCSSQPQLQDIGMSTGARGPRPSRHGASAAPGSSRRPSVTSHITNGPDHRHTGSHACETRQRTPQLRSSVVHGTPGTGKAQTSGWNSAAPPRGPPHYPSERGITETNSLVSLCQEQRCTGA